MIRIFTTAIGVFALPVILWGCQPQTVEEIGPDEVLYFETLGMGQNGTVRDTLEVVYRDEAAFQEALALVRPLGTLPPVDFSQMMVGLIAVPTESGGYVVEVQSIEKTADQISIHYEFSTPGQDCLTLQALSLPFQLVIIQRSEGEVTFVRNTKRYSCAL